MGSSRAADLGVGHHRASSEVVLSVPHFRARRPPQTRAKAKACLAWACRKADVPAGFVLAILRQEAGGGLTTSSALLIASWLLAHWPNMVQDEVTSFVVPAGCPSCLAGVGSSLMLTQSYHRGPRTFGFVNSARKLSASTSLLGGHRNWQETQLLTSVRTDSLACSPPRCALRSPSSLATAVEEMSSVEMESRQACPWLVSTQRQGNLLHRMMGR